MIDHATIERILDAAEISDVVSDFVTLRKRGVNMLGLCPFHNEKTPSFTVSPAKGIFKCFGCGKAGNSVNFIMEHENLTYPESLKWLAKKYHIDVIEHEDTEEQKQLNDERESLMIVSGFAQKYFTRYLWEENEGRTVGLSYFRERGFRDDIMKKFEVGFAPDGKTPITDAAQKEGYKIEFLEKTGLSIKRDDWVRDRFAGRVMFPIHNLAGRVIAFGGRILKEDKNMAKYLNSPESEIYHKSKVLYGIFQAKREISKADKCYLVEGYTDVLSMHQAGIENVVASSGTALTADQIRLIKRFTPNITIIYDGDEAGVNAAKKGIDLALQEDLKVKAILLPSKDDPDSFVKKNNHTSIIKFFEENEVDFISFLIGDTIAKTVNDPITKAQKTRELTKLITLIPDKILREDYLSLLSKKLDIPLQTLYNEQKRIISQSDNSILQKKTLITEKIFSVRNEDFQEEELAFLRFLLKFCNFPLFELEGENPGEVELISVGEFMISELEKDDLISDNELFRRIFKEVKENLENKNFDPWKYFIYHPNGEVSALATDLLSEKFIESNIWKRGGGFTEKEDDILDLLVPKIINEYKARKIRMMLPAIEAEINTAFLEDNFEKVIDEQSKYMNLKRVEKDLSEKLGNRAMN